MAGQPGSRRVSGADTSKASEFWGSLFGWKFEEYRGLPAPYLMTRFSDNSGGAIYGADGDGAGSACTSTSTTSTPGSARAGARRRGRRGDARSRRWAGSYLHRPAGTSSVSGRTTRRRPCELGPGRTVRGPGGRAPSRLLRGDVHLDARASSSAFARGLSGDGAGTSRRPPVASPGASSGGRSRCRPSGAAPPR